MPVSPLKMCVNFQRLDPGETQIKVNSEGKRLSWQTLLRNETQKKRRKEEQESDRAENNWFGSNENNKTRGMLRKLGLQISSNQDDVGYSCLVGGIQCKAGEDLVQCQKCELWSRVAVQGTTLFTRVHWLWWWPRLSVATRPHFCCNSRIIFSAILLF
jgi:hypothetical protein